MKNYVILILLLSSIKLSYSEAVIKLGTHTKAPLSNLIRHIYKEIFKDLNLKISFKEYPGRRLILMVNSGELDGDAARVENFKSISNDKTSNYILVEEPIIWVELVQIVKANVFPELTGWNEINKGSVCYVHGSKRVRMHVNVENRIPLGKVIQCLKMIQLGRVRSGVIFRRIANHTIKNDSELTKNLKIIDKSIMGYNMYLYLHKSQAGLKTQIEESLRKIKKNGVYNSLIKNYL